MNAIRTGVAWFASVLIIMVVSAQCGAELKNDPSSLFKVGDYRDIEISVPREGLLGAPFSPAARPKGKKIPSAKEDWRSNYVRITVFEIAKADRLRDYTRIALRLDEIDPNGSIMMHPGKTRKDPPIHVPAYYAYLFIKPSGCRIVGTADYSDPNGLNWKDAEVGPDRPGRTVRYGIVFPLTFTLPPAVNPLKDMRSNSFMGRNGGILFAEPV